MPSSFSRRAVRPARCSTAIRKLLAMVSPMLSFSRSAMASVPLSPRLFSLPAPFAAGAFFLGTKVEFLHVLRLHQPLAGIGHDDAAYLQYVAVVGDFEGHFRILLHQQDRDAFSLIDAPDDGKDFLHQQR